ncbi:MAG: hypothetical protein CL927_18275 [Deltaproteobacteria bacterium]|nr:hypothetical protein [Deltaproteobacteria bacterium]
MVASRAPVSHPPSFEVPLPLFPFALVIALSACAPKSPEPVQSPAVSAPGTHPQGIRVPPLDDRTYHYFELENGMKAMVVSDPDADMAAAALDVHVGQFSDPSDREGLAHFLEHMLFLGTDAFPDVDAYRNYVQSHGGRSNAATGQEHTRYHFEVDHAHLEGALDRFSAFFTSPRLDREYVTREREAVNSEYRLKIQTQTRRFREVRRATSNPAHGFAKFSVGNLTTLADRPDALVWDDLKTFYDRRYSADRMAVTVVGREPIHTLEGFVRDRFAAVTSVDAPSTEPAPPIYTQDQLGVRVHVAPLDEIRELYVEFLVPPQLTTYRSHALGLMTSLFGQEGPGSPHAVLTEKGWITSLTSGSDGAEDHTLLTIRMNLTEAGLEHVDDVAGVLLQFARLLNDPATLKPYWEQQRRLSGMRFDNAEQARSAAVARGTVRAMHLYPSSEVLSFWAEWSEYDPDQVAEHVARIRPDNMRMFVTAPNLPRMDQVEPRYNVAWGMHPLDPALVQHWNETPTDPVLALPPLNPFVPEDTSLLAGSDPEAVPIAVVDTPGLRVWHLQDTTFDVPRAAVSARVHLPGRAGTLEHQIRMVLWARLVDQHLASMLDQARTAGVQPVLQSQQDGMVLAAQGYSDKLDAILAAMVQGALEAPLDPVAFEIFRRDLLRRYRNTTTTRPIDQVGWAMSEAFNPRDWSYAAGAEYLESLRFEDLESWRADLFETVYIEVMAHGNLSAETATELGHHLQAHFASAAAATPVSVEIRRVPIGRALVRTVAVDHDDSAISVLYQGADTDLAVQARWLMLGTLMKTPAFTQLRTEQQLGYLVWARYDRRDLVPGLSLNIQSGVAHPGTLLERIDAFLQGFGPYLTDLSTEEYETIRTGLIATLEEAPTSLGQRTRDLAADLALGVTTFDRKAQIVSLLRDIEKADIEALFAEEVLGKSARRIVVQATGRSHAEHAAPAGACATPDCVVARMDAPFTRKR